MYSHPHETQVVPHLLQQVVEVPLVVGGDWDGVRDAIDYVQLLHRDLVDLVEQVDARNVDPLNKTQSIHI